MLLYFWLLVTLLVRMAPENAPVQKENKEEVVNVLKIITNTSFLCTQ